MKHFFTKQLVPIANSNQSQAKIYIWVATPLEASGLSREFNGLSLSSSILS